MPWLLQAAGKYGRTLFNWEILAMVRTLLALIGLLALAAGGVGYYKFNEFKAGLDPQAMQMYSDFFSKFTETRDLVDAMMWSVQVQDGISAEDLKESLKSRAVAHNFFFVGESPFYKQAEAVTGKPFRYINFLSFCDVNVGMEMADYNDRYTAFMPCRIAIVEDKNKKLWLHSMNLDMMIYGGKPLPPELKVKAIKVRDTIYAIMQEAAKGEF
jgi:uncharacterized protein (DUF302 family)